MYRIYQSHALSQRFFQVKKSYTYRHIHTHIHIHVHIPRLLYRYAIYTCIHVLLYVHTYIHTYIQIIPNLLISRIRLVALLSQDTYMFIDM
jgi:hypothetical protein